MSQLSFTGILVAFLFAAFFPGCENNSHPDFEVEPNPKDIQGTAWQSVNKKGEPEIENFERSKLLFLEDKEFELQRKFEYSGSTFRSIGSYEIEDSMITLKPMRGTSQIGNAFIYNDGKLKIEWGDSYETYGEGTDYYKMLE
ncbi:MAG: hypothetical protein ACLFT6_01615 [Bacteroidales bacterium]